MRPGLATDLVAEMQYRAGSFLNPQLIDAPTQRTRYQKPGEVVSNLPPAGSTSLAVFGCGDREDQGWLRHLLEFLKLDHDHAPVTDVGLNLLSADGEEVPIPDVDGQAVQYGVDMTEIRGLAQGRGKLAMLVTSGPSKGIPIVAIVRAGAANSILCDQKAARAVLAELAPPKTGDGSRSEWGGAHPEDR
jgi:DNA-binding transcriptional regulator LsrR (DeoR family)